MPGLAGQAVMAKPAAASGATTYLDLPGSTGNFASASDSVPLSITGDIDIRVKVAMDDWTPAAVMTLLGKWVATGNQRSYQLWLNTDGKLHLQLSTNGSSGASAPDIAASAATGITDGTTSWVRVTWRQSDGRTQFFKSTDGSSWTQIGTDVTNTATGIFNSTAPLEVGSIAQGSTQYAAGNFRRAQVRNNILDDGTGIVFDANFELVTILGTRNPTTFAESSSNAATVTMNGTGWDWGSS